MPDHKCTKSSDYQQQRIYIDWLWLYLRSCDNSWYTYIVVLACSQWLSLEDKGQLGVDHLNLSGFFFIFKNQFRWMFLLLSFFDNFNFTYTLFSEMVTNFWQPVWKSLKVKSKYFSRSYLSLISTIEVMLQYIIL